MRKMSIEALDLGGPTMGTCWSVRVERPVPDRAGVQAALQAAVAEVDAQMSTWRPDSDLMRLNAAPVGDWIALPARLMQVLAAGLEISRQTGGAFEMNVGDAVRAWGFGAAAIDLAAIRAASATPRVSAVEALELEPDQGRARKTAPLALDLSGIAKGYGVDRLAETALDCGIGSALCSIDGEVRALGGRVWSVGIDTPDAVTRGQHSVLELAGTAVATSGDYRHFVTVRGVRLSHTMDPVRGAPVVGAPASVTVLGQSCMMADAMATALMVMGAGRGKVFADKAGISALFLQDQAAVGTGVFAAAA